jgi:hypothetical protein
VPETNSYLHLSQYSSLTDIFHLSFNNKISELTQRQTNLYTEKQIKKKSKEGPLKPKSIYAQWNEASVQEIKMLSAVRDD